MWLISMVGMAAVDCGDMENSMVTVVVMLKAGKPPGVMRMVRVVRVVRMTMCLGHGDGAG